MFLLVGLAHYGVDRADEYDGIGNHGTLHHPFEDLQIGEAGRVDLEPPGGTGAVGVDVKAEFTFGGFDGVVGFGAGGGHGSYIGHHEIVDHALHRVVDFVFGGVGVLGVVGADGAAGHLVEALLDDVDALLHFVDADVVAGQGIALGTDGDFEIELVVDEVGFGDADIELDPAAPQVGTGEAVGDSILAADVAHVLGAVDPDGVAVQEVHPVLEFLAEFLAEAADHGDALVGEVELDAADAAVADGEAHAGDFVKNGIDVLALAEGEHEHGNGPGIHDHGAEPEQVGRDAGQLAGDGADVLGPLGDLDAYEFFDGQTQGHVARIGGEVVHAVGVGHELLVGFVFGQFFDAAVQVADVEDAFLDAFAVELGYDAQYAVGGGVLGPDVEHHFGTQGVAFVHFNGRVLGFEAVVDGLLVLGEEGKVGPLFDGHHGAELGTDLGLLQDFGRHGLGSDQGASRLAGLKLGKN